MDYEIHRIVTDLQEKGFQNKLNGSYRLVITEFFDGNQVNAEKLTVEVIYRRGLIMQNFCIKSPKYGTFWYISIFNGYVHGKITKMINYKCVLECYYSYGKLHGAYREHDMKGYLHIKCYYNGGELHGRYVEYYPGTTQLKIQANYNFGKRIGAYERYHANGNISDYCSYFSEKGIPSGIYLRYNDEGNLLANLLYQDGCMTMVF